MRTAFLIPLAFTATVLAGCGGEVSNGSEREDTASRAAASLKRDLTLSMPQLPATEVASAVELGTPKPAPAPTRRHRTRSKPAPAPAPVPAAAAEPEATPVTTPTVGEAIAEAVVDDAAGGGRELAPGRTITIIPVSNGPSVEADEGDSWLPAGPSRGVLVGGGGTCRRRGGGGGIGIAARFRVGITGLPLR
jgi:biotin carboxyl carrier protein